MKHNTKRVFLLLLFSMVLINTAGAAQPENRQTNRLLIECETIEDI